MTGTPVRESPEVVRTLRVLQSVRGPSPTTNPYVVQLVDAVAEHVHVEWFSWRRGLFGRYDVLHVHWPEVMVRRAGRLARWAARARFAALLARLATSRSAVVRTLHNVHAHEHGSPVERLLLRWCDRRTDFWILLNPASAPPRPGPSATILHGHYVDWFRSRPTQPVVDHRILMFGLIRPYKGTDVLLTAFDELDDEKASLRIVGRPTTDELRDMIRQACERDGRITAQLEYVDEATLAEEVGRAQLVVLPYHDMHNSGALLLALSLARPALVPRTPATLALGKEVGPYWVRTYAGGLTGAHVAAALAATAGPDGTVPDLRGREWPLIGEQHVAAYGEAVRQRRSHFLWKRLRRRTHEQS